MTVIMWPAERLLQAGEAGTFLLHRPALFESTCAIVQVSLKTFHHRLPAPEYRIVMKAAFLEIYLSLPEFEAEEIRGMGIRPDCYDLSAKLTVTYEELLLRMRIWQGA